MQYRIVYIFFVLYCNKSPHPPEGALTPASWRSHGRLPSWCCGSDLSPPLCSPRMGRWQGCSLMQLAEPAERRRRAGGKRKRWREEKQEDRKMEVAMWERRCVNKGKEEGQREMLNYFCGTLQLNFVFPELLRNLVLHYGLLCMCTCLQQVHSWRAKKRLRW